MSVAWSLERVEQLRILAAQRLSASQIAREIGGITRCAVLGKAKRVGIQIDSGAPGAWTKAEDLRLIEAIAAGTALSVLVTMFPDRPLRGIERRRLRLGMRRAAERAPRKNRIVNVVPLETIEAATTEPVRFIDLRLFRSDRPNECRRFLKGQAGVNGIVCSAPTAPGKSYCPTCARRLLVPVSVAEARVRRAA